MHNNSKLIFEKYAIPFFRETDKVLEMGAHVPSPFQGFLREHGVDVKDWRYADIVSDRSAVYAQYIDLMMPDEYTIPCDSETFDVVFSAQVLEHVRKPWVWLRELQRVLKKDGTLITISPVSWPYHEAPIDCWRAHPEGMRALYEDSGLAVDIAVSGCFETTGKITPGMGLEILRKRKPFYYYVNTFLSYFGYPREACIDAITIGHKL